MRDKLPRSAIFVITEYGHRDLTEQCVKSIPPHHNIYVGNDGCTEVFHQTIPGANVIDWAKNVRYVKNANRTAQVATGYMGTEAVMIISNNDMIYNENAINILVDYVIKHKCIAGPTLTMPRIFVPDGGKGAHIQHYDINGLHLRPDAPVDITALSGCCLAMTVGTWRRLGGYDEDFIDYSSDNDLCIRALQNGIPVRYVPEAVVDHLAGKSYTDGHLPHRELLILDQKTLKMKHPRSEWNNTGIFKYE